jgi:hypothetical protein
MMIIATITIRSKIPTTRRDLVPSSRMAFGSGLSDNLQRSRGVLLTIIIA